MNWVYKRWKAGRWVPLEWTSFEPFIFWVKTPWPWDDESCTALIKEGPKALVRFQKEEA